MVLSLTVALALSGCSRQQSDWEKTRAANTTDAYELFLKKYPSGEFTAQAQARVKELYEERDWQKARDTDTLEAYQAFLKQYPEGKWTEEARIRVENFTLAAAPSAPAQPGAETPPPEAAAQPTAPKPAPSANTFEAGCGQNARQHRARTLRRNRKDPMAFSSVHLNPAPMPRTNAGRGSTRNIPSCCRDLSPKVSPKKGSSGTLYRLQVAGLTEKRAKAICKTLKAHRQACVLIHQA